MRDPFEMTQDHLWTEKNINLAGRPVEFAVRYCESGDAATALCEKYCSQIYSCGGAIIVGNARPVRMITAQEIERYATLGLAIPKQEPYWIEVVVFRKVTFQQMLDYMALAEFGKTRPHDPEQIRSEAYRVLTAANTIGPMCFQEINQYAVSVRYMAKVPADALDDIIERALTFSETFFTMDLGRDEWRRQYRAANGFVLGPG